MPFDKNHLRHESLQVPAEPPKATELILPAVVEVVPVKAPHQLLDTIAQIKDSVTVWGDDEAGALALEKMLADTLAREHAEGSYPQKSASPFHY